jgi:hypothetical protein
MLSLYVFAARLADDHAQSHRSSTPHPVIEPKYHSIEFLPFCSAHNASTIIRSPPTSNFFISASWRVHRRFTWQS